MRLFFYGTMLDPDVRRIVLAQEAESLTIRPAVLGGYRRVRAAWGGYPVLVRRGAGRVRGELIEGLGPEGLARVAHFEGPDYLPESRTVVDETGRRLSAWIMLSRAGRRTTTAVWELRAWQLRRKTRLLPQLRRWMVEYEMMGRHSVDISWPMRRRLAAMSKGGDSLGSSRGETRR